MTPKAIVNGVESRLGVTGSPLQLTDAIEQELLSKGFSAATAAERVDQLKLKVVSEIIRRRDERDQLGEIAVLHLHGAQNEIVHGSSYVFSTDAETIRQSKLNRVLVSDIQTYIKRLDFIQFEVFGRQVLKEIGCRNPKVTQHSGDQGIDFYGDLSVGGLLGADPKVFQLMHKTRVILVGQAKHYPNSAIGPGVVRELVGALSLARSYTFSKDNIDLLNDVQLKPFSPLLALLFTTGDFTKGARHLADKAGLIAFSGWQLSVFLADKGIGLLNDGGIMRFDPQTFDAWLS